MSDATQNPKDNFSFLDLPDEELAKYSLADLASGAVQAPATATAATTDEEAEAEKVPTNAKADVAEGEGEGVGQEPGKEAAEGAEGDALAADAAKAPVTEGVKEEVKDEGKEAPKTEDKPKESTKSEVDYKSAYEKLLAPFKANGRDIQVESVDEAIQLMQMGANYNKKMAGLKPNLMLLKLLETNGLLSEEKIGFLIDLDKKNPEAINKLIKDSGLDPMDLDAKKADGYKPTARKVDEQEVELDAVMDEIQDTAAFPKTLEVVGKKWDVASRAAVAQFPQVIKVINTHIESGVFDKIVARVERARLFGKLSGLSDLDAYRQVGDEMNARGEFNSLGRQEEQKTPEKKIVTPNTEKSEQEEALKNKKRAASGAKSVNTPAPAQDFNPLALSDDDFMKIQPGKY